MSLKGRVGKGALVGVIAITAVLGQGVFAFAGDRDRFDRDRHDRDRGFSRERHRNYHREHYPVGRVERVLPSNFLSVNIGGLSLSLSDGVYYRRYRNEYVVVEPPSGTFIYRMPQGCSRIYVNNVEYYTYRGIYYRRHRGGYIVTEPPPTVIVERVPVTSAIVGDAMNEDFTVIIPNKQGGYTSVLLKKVGSGFTGPQGEFYPEFPKVAQLVVMYGK